MSRIATRFLLPPRLLLLAAVAAIAGAAVLAAVWTTLGEVTAQAMYVSMLLLLTPSRRVRPSLQWAAGAWALAVAVGGYLVGPWGWTTVLVGLAVVSVGQAAFPFGHAAGIARSPVNFLLFAGLSLKDAPLWQVVVGAALGIALMLVASRFARPASAMDAAPDPLRVRLGSGLLLAAGAVLLVGVGELLRYPYVSWALLSLCMILAVDIGARTGRARERVVGSAAGALLAVGLSALPGVLPWIGLAVCAVLCVAYVARGDYTLFILFLTPAVLLTSAGESSPLLALHRVLAVLIAAVLAGILTWVGLRIGAWRAARERPLSTTAP